MAGTAWVGEGNVVHMEFDMDDDYAGFIDNLRSRLADNREQAAEVITNPWLLQHPLLPKQRYPATPARWMYIKLIVESRNITLAVRDDNVYLIGFMNQRGRWYEFGFEEDSGHMIW